MDKVIPDATANVHGYKLKTASEKARADRARTAKQLYS